MTLSILIPSLETRKPMLMQLLHHLVKINNSVSDVQILTNIDNRQKTTGKKREELLQQAQGKYVVFIDDDDWVPEYYVDEMLRACASDCDCVAINGNMTTNGQHDTKWFMSKDFQNRDVREGNQMVYYRRTNHITAVKREIALRAGFPDKSNAEDKYYSDRLVLHSEFKIEKPMYTYRFSTVNKSYK
jgi:glycosyltransferase involved in cell wall biosynthesis